jgi:hypothetical protein
VDVLAVLGANSRLFRSTCQPSHDSQRSECASVQAEINAAQIHVGSGPVADGAPEGVLTRRGGSKLRTVKTLMSACTWSSRPPPCSPPLRQPAHISGYLAGAVEFLRTR